MIVFVMGICGSGKSTIGNRLAAELACPFFDGDDYHSIESRNKMTNGIGLTDADRLPWLERLSQIAQEMHASGRSAVIACSALKASYRDILRQGLANDNYCFVFLEIGREEAVARLETRQAHYMKAGMVDGQLACLEPPDPAVHRTVAVDATLALDDLIVMIVSLVK